VSCLVVWCEFIAVVQCDFRGSWLAYTATPLERIFTDMAMREFNSSEVVPPFCPNVNGYFSELTALETLSDAFVSVVWRERCDRRWSTIQPLLVSAAASVLLHPIALIEIKLLTVAFILRLHHHALVSITEQETSDSDSCNT
jgi:hypothetical protein